MNMITDHWYRTGRDPDTPPGGPFDRATWPCAFHGCGRPYAEHRDAVGEWMDTPHWFIPRPARPAWCRRCGRWFSNVTHRGAPERRRLYGPIKGWCRPPGRADDAPETYRAPGRGGLISRWRRS